MKDELRKLHEEYVFRLGRHRELLSLLALSEDELKRIEKEKKKFYLPPPPPFDLPKDLMAEAEWARLLKMKRGDSPCEYCGGDNVRIGKGFDLCQDCRHCKPK